MPEAARYLGVSRRTFYDYVRKDVPCVKVGGAVAFDVTDLDAWAEAHKERPKSAVSEALDERPLAAPTPTAQHRYAQERLARLRAQK